MAAVLITGGNGFIGSHVVNALLSQHHNVTVLSRNSEPGWRLSPVANQINQITWHDNQSVEKWFNASEEKYIIHLSTFYSKSDHPEQLEEMVRVNIADPMRLLELAVASGTKGFVNTGTFFEYKPSAKPLSESSTISPVNLYARTKVGFEQILSSYSENLPSVSLKLFSPFGEKDNPKLINYLIENLLLKKPIQLSSGYQRLDFIHVQDIAQAYIQSIEHLREQASGHNAVNIGSGKASSIRNLVSTIESQLGLTGKIGWAAASDEDKLSISLADISKAKRLLGWQPKLSLSQGIQQTIQQHETPPNA